MLLLCKASAWFFPGPAFYFPPSLNTPECVPRRGVRVCDSVCVTCHPQCPCPLVPPSAEGPCLVHTITGDLLRALEGPENCSFPRLISVSSEGHCIIYYERGRFSNFSINGKLLARMEINDSTRVSLPGARGPGRQVRERLL